MLAPAEAARLRDANAQAAERAASRDARIQRVTTLTEPLDPTDPEDRAAASDYWESIADVYLFDDPDEQRANELAFVERLGVLPDGLARKYQGALLSDDPALAVSGARAIAALNELNPALVADFRPDRMHRAEKIADFAALDLSPERAVDLAEKEIGKDGMSAVPSAAKRTNAAEAVEPVVEGGISPGADAPPLPDGDVDQTDGLFEFGDGEGTDGAVGVEVERPEDASAEGAPVQGAAEEDAQSDIFDELFRQGPDWSEVEGLGDILESQGETAFAAAAEEAGLSPEVTRLFVDLLQATPDDQQAIFERIDKKYGQGYGVFLKPLIADHVLQNESAEARKALLAPHLWQSRSDAPLQLGIGAVLGGGLFGPGVGRGRGNRPNKPQSKGPVRQPGPARRGDFAPGPVGQREWNEMQQRIRAGLPKGFKSLDDVRGLASIFQKQMAASGNPHARLAIRGSAVTNRSFDEETGKYTGHRFDQGKEKSDFDFAIVDGALFNKAVRAGVDIVPAGTRTMPMGFEGLQKIGQGSIAESMKKVVG